MSLTFFYSVYQQIKWKLFTNLRLPAGCHVGISTLWRPGVEGMWPNPYPTSSFLHTQGRAVAIWTFTRTNLIFRILICNKNDLDMLSLRPALVTWLTCCRNSYLAQHGFGQPKTCGVLTWSWQAQVTWLICRRNYDLCRMIFSIAIDTWPDC